MGGEIIPVTERRLKLLFKNSKGMAWISGLYLHCKGLGVMVSRIQKVHKLASGVFCATALSVLMGLKDFC